MLNLSDRDFYKLRIDYSIKDVRYIDTSLLPPNLRIIICYREGFQTLVRELLAGWLEENKPPILCSVFPVQVQLVCKREWTSFRDSSISSHWLIESTSHLPISWYIPNLPECQLWLLLKSGGHCSHNMIKRLYNMLTEILPINLWHQVSRKLGSSVCRADVTQEVGVSVCWLYFFFAYGGECVTVGRPGLISTKYYIWLQKILRTGIGYSFSVHTFSDMCNSRYKL